MCLAVGHTSSKFVVANSNVGFLSCFFGLGKPELLKEMMAYAPKVVSAYPQANISPEMRVAPVRATV